jgi:hypothetical protein
MSWNSCFAPAVGRRKKNPMFSSFGTVVTTFRQLKYTWDDT